MLVNFLDQGVLLPRQETIRDDLRRVDDLNRLSRRVRSALDEIDPYLVASARPGADRGLMRDDSGGAEGSLQDDVADRGVAYAGYYRLRVESVTEDLAGIVERALGLPPGREYEAAIRALLRAWIDRRYPASRAEARPGMAGRKRFLQEFDLAYQLRRSSFLQRRIDRLYPLDDEMHELFLAAGFSYWPDPDDPQAIAEFREHLLALKAAAAAAGDTLRAAERDLGRRPRPGAEHPFQAAVAATGVSLDDLTHILADPRDEVRHGRAAAVLLEHLSGVDVALSVAADEIRRASGRAFDLLDRAMGALPEGPAAGAAGAFVSLSYNQFEDFDGVAFPLQYGSGAGEADPVDVIRISPNDAQTLVYQPTEKGAGKVTGSWFMHFGAFLDRIWRENDMMWGRLDAAEILIEALAPMASAPDADRAAAVTRLREMAQCAILREELSREDLATLLVASDRAEVPDSLSPKLQRLLETAGNCTELLEEFRVSYRRPEPGSLEPAATLRNVGRGAHILGTSFGDIARRGAGRKGAMPFAAVAKLGQLVTGAVEAAVPRSFGHLLAKHWFLLLYVFELLAIGIGVVLQVAGASATARPVIRFAASALALTLGANTALWLLARRLRGRKGARSWLWTFVKLVLFLVAAGVVVLAFLQLRHLGETHEWIPFFGAR